jgi:nitrite reductase/ring-hydroxylating ferredoxin subunit
VPANLAVLLGDDAWMARRLSRLDQEYGLVWVREPAPGTSPGLVVLDLATTDALEQVRSLRARWPQALVAGYLAVPDGQRWVAAQRAGCDLVANRGALVARLRPLLDLGAGPRRTRFPVMAQADLAGRLGLVGRVPQTPVGDVAVYQVDGAVSVCADACPHAGAPLSQGLLDRTIITCPRHGSQFDMSTGERVRGPADADLATYPVVVADGQVCLVIDGRPSASG